MHLAKSRSLNAKDLTPGNRKNGNPLNKGLKFDNVKRKKSLASILRMVSILRSKAFGISKE